MGEASRKTAKVFPADRIGARENLEAALQLRPQSSELWFAFAENDLYAGKVDHARAALSLADSLDPNYPGQVLRSAQLWELMGESDRAKSAVRRIAAWGGDWQTDSVKTSISLGFSPTEVFDFIDGNNLKAEQFVKVLPLLKSNDPSENFRLYKMITSQKVEQHRADILEFLMTPLSLPALMEAWAQSIDSQGTLLTPPFAVDLPLGWQKPSSGKVQASWLSPESRGVKHGALSVNALDGNFSWIMYRLPLSRSDLPRTITLDVKSSDPSVLLWMRAIPEEIASRSKAVPIIPNEWMSIQLNLNPIEADSIITIVLEGRNVNNPVEITSLRFTELGP